MGMGSVDDQHRWDEAIFSTTDAKRQHYVPEMYLKAFAGKNGQIGLFNAHDGKMVTRTSVDNVAVSARFNDMEIEGKRLSSESWLSEVEGNASPILNDLIEHPENIELLSVDEEFLLARFIAALRFRTPAFREWNEQVMGNFESQIKQNIHSDVIRHDYVV